MKINFLGYQLYVKLKKQHLPNSLGILSLTYDNKHVVLLDFDVPHTTKSKARIEINLWELQNKYNLGDFDLFETAGGYHAVCYSKVSYGEYVEIMNSLGDLLDYGFKIQAVLRPEQATTLRYRSLNTSKYSKFLYTIKKVSSSGWIKKAPREESNEHKQAFALLKGLQPEQLKNPLPVVYYYHNKTKHKPFNKKVIIDEKSEVVKKWNRSVFCVVKESNLIVILNCIINLIILYCLKVKFQFVMIAEANRLKTFIKN